MKAVKIIPPPVFTPVELKLTFESEAELDKFYAIMNHTWILDGSGFEQSANVIRAQIQRGGGCKQYINDITEYFRERFS